MRTGKRSGTVSEARCLPVLPCGIMQDPRDAAAHPLSGSDHAETERGPSGVAEGSASLLPLPGKNKAFFTYSRDVRNHSGSAERSGVVPESRLSASRPRPRSRRNRRPPMRQAGMNPPPPIRIPPADAGRNACGFAGSLPVQAPRAAPFREAPGWRDTPSLGGPMALT